MDHLVPSVYKKQDIVLLLSLLENHGCFLVHNKPLIAVPNMVQKIDSQGQVFTHCFSLMGRCALLRHPDEERFSDAKKAEMNLWLYVHMMHMYAIQKKLHPCLHMENKASDPLLPSFWHQALLNKNIAHEKSLRKFGPLWVQSGHVVDVWTLKKVCEAKLKERVRIESFVPVLVPLGRQKLPSLKDGFRSLGMGMQIGSRVMCLNQKIRIHILYPQDIHGFLGDTALRSELGVILHELLPVGILVELRVHYKTIKKWGGWGMNLCGRPQEDVDECVDVGLG